MITCCIHAELVLNELPRLFPDVGIRCQGEFNRVVGQLPRPFAPYALLPPAPQAPAPRTAAKRKPPPPTPAPTQATPTTLAPIPAEMGN